MEEKKQLTDEVEDKVAQVDAEIQAKLTKAINEKKHTFDETIKTLNDQVAELEKVNLSLEEQLNEQKQNIAQATQENRKLNRQADMQATMFERSESYFSRSLK